MTGRVTSFHVAALAGVSQPTVSRALRDHAEVSEDTRARVHDAARRLGYRTDRRAASLRGGSTGRIAVVILSVARDAHAAPNPFYMSLLAYIASAASSRGYDILVSFQHDPSTFHADYERNGEADGIIVVGTAKNRAGWAFFAEARRSGAHIICWGSPADTLPTVRCDNRAGATLAVGHLLARECRRIAFLGPGWEQHHAYRERRAGYVQAIANHDLEPVDAPPVLGVAGDDGHASREEEGYASTVALLDTAPRTDAIFAASDLLAMGAIRALHRRGLAVPDDVAVVGFDGIAPAQHLSPSLTTIEQDSAAAGDCLVAAVLAMAAGAEYDLSPIPMRLIARESSGATVS